ncbi:MAG: UDP-N-acetylmuramate dehydrogenase [Rhodospirillales bacterium]
MTAAARAQSALIDRLPPVHGVLTPAAPLAKYLWFRAGGAAEVLFQPAGAEDLAAFLAAKPADVPVTVMGAGSNLLVRDGGVSGVVVRLGRPFADVTVEGVRITAGAGAPSANAAKAARDAGVDGFAFLCGVPGAVGGAVRMNAGAYGAEVRDILVSATALDEAGNRRELSREDLNFGYRESALPEDWIVTEAVFEGAPGDAAEIARRMDEIHAEREAAQPIRTRTGGSTFKNPPGAKAWALIDAAGCRGLAAGAARISEKHTNFIVNEGGASADDIESLGEEVRRRVKQNSGVSLEWEIRRIGVPAPASAKPKGTAP